MNLSLALAIGMLSSCAKDENISPSSGSHSSFKAPEGDELLLSFAKKSLDGRGSAYTIDVLASGIVLFNGIENTEFRGEIKFEMDRDAAWDIAFEMQNQGFYDLQDEYPSDNGTNTTRATVLALDNENVKEVIDQGDAPDGLLSIQKMIVERTNVVELIGKE